MRRIGIQSGGEQRFATDPKPGQRIVTQLWTHDGTQMGSLRVVKEIWTNSGWNFSHVGPDELFLAFHVYDHFAPRHSNKVWGERINPKENPFLSYKDALIALRAREREILATGRWVPLERTKRPVLKR